MNGPVKMFVAEAFDEMMAGTLFADVSEPLYVNVLAPDKETAEAAEEGVIGPIMFIVAADEHTNPLPAAPPVIDPDILIVVAEVDTPNAVDVELLPFIDPVICRILPLNDIPIDAKPPAVEFPVNVKFPAV